MPVLDHGVGYHIAWTRRDGLWVWRDNTPLWAVVAPMPSVDYPMDYAVAVDLCRELNCRLGAA